VLRSLLDGLTNRPEVTGAAIVSGEGLLIDHLLPPGTDGDALAALAATVIRQVTELGSAARLGDPSTAILEFAGGPAILGMVDGGAALVVMARPDVDLGELLYLVRRHRPAVADAL
jgi:predicted regulator of Ras-like GTPase activity (Roadblock/LC7/MglB family)